MIKAGQRDPDNKHAHVKPEESAHCFKFLQKPAYELWVTTGVRMTECGRHKYLRHRKRILTVQQPKDWLNQVPNESMSLDVPLSVILHDFTIGLILWTHNIHISSVHTSKSCKFSLDSRLLYGKSYDGFIAHTKFSGAEEMAQWVKCLSQKYKDLSSDSQDPHTAGHGSMHL